MTVAIICTALLGVLVFGLGFAVSITRVKTKTGIGCSTDPADPVFKMVRAHGNATEYAAILALLFLLAGDLNAATWVPWVIGIATACRYIHAAGMICYPSMKNPNPLRFVGSLGTYLSGLALSVAVLLAV